MYVKLMGNKFECSYHFLQMKYEILHASHDVSVLGYSIYSDYPKKLLNCLLSHSKSYPTQQLPTSAEPER